MKMNHIVIFPIIIVINSRIVIDVYVKSLTKVGERSVEDGEDITPGLAYDEDKPKQGFKDMDKKAEKLAKKAKKQQKKATKGTHDRK